MTEKLCYIKCEDCQKLLDIVYEELKGSVPNITDAEICDRVQFLWYNVNEKIYEAAYYI
jgi:hypothetical protein